MLGISKKANTTLSTMNQKFMKKEDEQKWKDLYLELKDVQKRHTLYQISKRRNVYVTIEDVEVCPSGCGSCGIKYECMHLRGRIRADYLDEWKDYSAVVSLWDCHECNNPLITAFCPLFKGHIEDTEYCVCHWFVWDECGNVSSDEDSC